MIMALAVALGLIASAVRHRGQVAHQLASLQIHWGWLVLLALALQIPLLRAPHSHPEQVRLEQALFLLSHLLLLAFVWRNRRLTGIQILGVGLICNLLVLLANGGWMPISPETLLRINPGSSLDLWPAGFHYSHSKDLILPREATSLGLLSDRLVLPPPFPWPAAFSLGDLLIAAGIVVLLWGPTSLPGLVTAKPHRWFPWGKPQEFRGGKDL